MQPELFKRYGVIEQTASENDVEYACESIRHLGYAVIDGGYEPGRLNAMSEAFERAQQHQTSEHGGGEALNAIDEHNTIRPPLRYEPLCLALACNNKHRRL